MAAPVKQYVYFYGFGKSNTEGDASMKAILGGKGANLAEMANADLPVPPGFTISTEACAYYSKHNKQYPPDMAAQLKAQLGKLEKMMGKKLGDPNDPLLVSVRSGAASAAPMAAGRPKPMVPSPPEVSQRRGARCGCACAVHIWCWPTSVQTTASGPASRAAACTSP